jgi:hypothetical protein
MVQRPSLSFGHPHHSHPHPHSHSTGSPHMEHDNLMSMLSPHEEEEVLRAQGAVQDTDGEPSLSDSSHLPHQDLLSSMNLGGLSHSHQSLPPQRPLPLGNMAMDDTPYAPSISGLGTGLYTRPQHGFAHSKFDFSHLEAFAADEKEALGLTLREGTTELRKRLAGLTNGVHSPANGVHSPMDNGLASPLTVNGATRTDELIPGLGASETNSNFVRKRQRKLSQSNTANPRRQNKLALFEGAPPPTDTTNLPAGEGGIGSGGAAPPSQTGHDRPYRFSFYSNKLSATIHARSLSELPAEGQTFEDLFTGGADVVENGTGEITKGTVTAAGTGSAGKATPIPIGGTATPEAAESASRHGGGNGGSKGTEVDDDVKTWWLDVLSPTNEEMAMLSKVGLCQMMSRDELLMRFYLGLQHSSVDDRRYSNGGDARKD